MPGPFITPFPHSLLESDPHVQLSGNFGTFPTGLVRVGAGVSFPRSRRQAEYGSGNTVSKTELSEFLGPHQVSEREKVSKRELSEFLSAYHLCTTATSPTFSKNSPMLPQNSVSSLLRNSTLEPEFRPCPEAFSNSHHI